MTLLSLQPEKPTISGWLQPDKKIIILDSNAIRSRIMSRILWLTGHVELKTYLHEIPEQWDLLVVNYDNMSDVEKTSLHQKYASSSSRKIIILSCNQPPFDYMNTSDGLCWKNFLTIKNDINVEELLITAKKILSPNIFGIEKYFGWEACSFATTINKSIDRENVWNITADFAAKTGIPSRLQNMFCTVVDELITNALYNAPVDSLGKPKYSFLPRTTEVSLDTAISIVFYCDGRRLGVAVSDPFGSLSSTTIVSYLSRCSQKGTPQIVQTSGGAGLGLYSVFESLSHLVVNIDRGVRTEVIGLLDIRGTYKDFVSQGKSLNIFEV